MGELDRGWIESIFGHSNVYGNEEATELQVLLGERG
jgi:hypothetical protein